MEKKDIDLSSKLSLTCGVNVNYYKSVHHPIPTQHPGNFQNKSVSSLFNSVSRYIMSRGARRGNAFWDYSQAYLVVIKDEKVCPFVKFEIILPLPCCLLDQLYNMQQPDALSGLSSQSFSLKYSLHFFLKKPDLKKLLIFSQKSFPNFQETKLSCIQNPSMFRTRGIFRTLSNIYDGMLCKKHFLASSLKIFP